MSAYRTARLLSVLLLLTIGQGCIVVSEVEVVPVCSYLWAEFDNQLQDDPIERWRIYEAMELNHCHR
jgi:hypothetical protein